MIQRLKLLLVFFIILSEVSLCSGQSPVTWQFAAAPLKGHETTLLITADVPAGWHLYSQSIKEGGHIPTRIKYTPGDDYILKGVTAENGEATTFYDDIYEMEITWYTGIVTFSQRISVTNPEAVVKGSIEYMTCNKEVCIPAEQAFSIKISGQKP